MAKFTISTAQLAISTGVTRAGRVIGTGPLGEKPEGPPGTGMVKCYFVRVTLQAGHGPPKCGAPQTGHMRAVPWFRP